MKVWNIPGYLFRRRSRCNYELEQSTFIAQSRTQGTTRSGSPEHVLETRPSIGGQVAIRNLMPFFEYQQVSAPSEG